MSHFDSCIEFVLRHEGGYVFDPRDAGGETKYGISKRAFPGEDIKALTEARARDLYRTQYWGPIRGDSLPLPVALVVLDFAVNSGVGTASRELQRSIGAAADGVIGPKTLEALSLRAPLEVCRDVIARRVCFLAGLDQPHFLRGWIRRCVFLAFEAATLA